MERKAFLAALGVAAGGVAVAAVDVAAAPPAAAADGTGMPYLDVRDFGAVGDGVADDSPALQAAVDALELQGNARVGVVYIPGGDYRIATRVTAKAGNWRIRILGDGMGVTRLFGDNTDGILKLDANQRQTCITVEHLSLFAPAPGCGTALEFTMPEGGALHNRTLVVQHIEMRGVNAPTDYFNNGLVATGQWRPLVYDAAFSGVFGPGTDAGNPDGAHYIPHYAFRVDGSYAPAFHYCYAWSARVGYSVFSELNPGPEDASFYRSFAVECGVGIDVDTPHPDGEPQLEIDTLHISCFEVGIRLRHRKYFQITNCLLYNYVYINKPSHPFTDIELIDSFGGIIEHNIFHQPTNPERTMIDINGGCFDIQVRGNLFNASHTAVKVAEGAKNIRVAGNDFNTGVDPVASLQLVSTILQDATGEVVFTTDDLRRAQVRRAEAMAFGGGAWTPVAWQEVDADTDGFFADTAPTLLTVPVDRGIRFVRLTASVGWQDTPGVHDSQSAAVRVNGKPAVGAPVIVRSGVPGAGVPGSAPMVLTTAALAVKGGDTLSVEVQHGGSSRTLSAADTWMCLEVVDG